MSAPLNLNAIHQAREWHHREHSRAESVEILRNDWSVVICKRKCDIVDDCLMPKYNSSEKDEREVDISVVKLFVLPNDLYLFVCIQFIIGDV